MDAKPRMDVTVVVPQEVIDFWKWPFRIGLLLVAIATIYFVISAWRRRTRKPNEYGWSIAGDGGAKWRAGRMAGMEPHIESLLRLDYPADFIVEYVDGKREVLLRGDGVLWNLPTDDPNGIGGIHATLPKKHPQHQKVRGRYIGFNELKAIYTVSGEKLWPPNS